MPRRSIKSFLLPDGIKICPKPEGLEFFSKDKGKGKKILNSVLKLDPLEQYILSVKGVSEKHIAQLKTHIKNSAKSQGYESEKIMFNFDKIESKLSIMIKLSGSEIIQRYEGNWDNVIKTILEKDFYKTKPFVLPVSGLSMDKIEFIKNEIRNATESSGYKKEKVIFGLDEVEDRLSVWLNRTP